MESTAEDVQPGRFLRMRNIRRAPSYLEPQHHAVHLTRSNSSSSTFYVQLPPPAVPTLLDINNSDTSGCESGKERKKEKQHNSIV